MSMAYYENTNKRILLSMATRMAHDRWQVITVTPRAS